MQDDRANTQVEEGAGKKKKSRKQLKRPQGEIKTNLTSVWGGATPVPAATDGEVKQVGLRLAIISPWHPCKLQADLYVQDRHRLQNVYLLYWTYILGHCTGVQPSQSSLDGMQSLTKPALPVAADTRQ